jgi:hypothetical protein
MTLEEERSALNAWAGTFLRVLNASPTLAPLSEDASLTSITFPRVIRPEDLLGVYGHFHHHPAMEEHVRQLGFGWDATGRLRTSPTPLSLKARREALGFGHCGYDVQLFAEGRSSLPLGRWLTLYLDGVMPLQVSTPEWYEACLSGQTPLSAVNRLRFQLMSLAHDLTVHALNYHLIPRTAIDDWRARITASVPDRVAAWKEPGAAAPLTLTYFLDNDLNRYCYAAWCLTPSPDAFSEIFLRPANYDQLLRALEIRLQETHAGRGDVPGGNTDAMGQLQATTFELR